MCGEVAILPFEIQQRLHGCCLFWAQRFHLTDDNQVVTCSVFCVNFAIKPMQAATNDRIAQRRLLPLDTVPLVCALSSKGVGNLDLFA